MMASRKYFTVLPLSVQGSISMDGGGVLFSRETLKMGTWLEWSVLDPGRGKCDVPWELGCKPEMTEGSVSVPNEAVCGPKKQSRVREKSNNSAL